MEPDRDEEAPWQLSFEVFDLTLQLEVVRSSTATVLTVMLPFFPPHIILPCLSRCDPAVPTTPTRMPDAARFAHADRWRTFRRAADEMFLLPTLLDARVRITSLFVHQHTRRSRWQRKSYEAHKLEQVERERERASATGARRRQKDSGNASVRDRVRNKDTGT